MQLRRRFALALGCWAISLWPRHEGFGFAGARPYVRSSGAPLPAPSSCGSARLSHLSRRAPRGAEGTTAAEANQTEEPPGSKAATLAWLEERASTEEGQEIGTLLFLAKKKKRKEAAEEALVLVKSMLSSADGEDLLKVNDAMFLCSYICSAQAGPWLGADAWPASFLSKASVPGLKPRDVVQAALNGMDPQVVKPEETQKILDAYVSATWGEETSFGTLEAFDGVMISVPPQQASIQYCLGILWGYAIRGMVKRLALDRQLDTVPESMAVQRWQLERSLDIDFRESTTRRSGPPSFMEYANEFFSHEDWAELCKPSNAAVTLLEAELQEAMHGMAILSSVSQEDAFEVISSSEEEFENDFELDLVLLDQGEWKAFQYRAVAYGILLADAEALVEREVLLERSPRSWVRTLVETRVLTELRPEQSRRVATSIQAPLRRVVQVLKDKVVASKLTEARQSLSKLLSSRAAAAGAASAGAAAEAFGATPDA